MLKLVKRLCTQWRQNFCSTLTGSFSCFWYYWSPNSSLTSLNCLWHLFYYTPVVLIISAGQKSVCCCHQFFFLSFSFNVWLSTRLGAGSCPVCLVHYSTFRHHSQSFSQPSAFFFRRHPTSKINSTERRTKPYKWPAIMHRWFKIMAVLQSAQT